jgi:hypothetical protein
VAQIGDKTAVAIDQTGGLALDQAWRLNTGQSGAMPGAYVRQRTSSHDLIE